MGLPQASSLSLEPLVRGIAALNPPIDGGSGARAIAWRIAP